MSAFNACIQFFHERDENGSMAWNISDQKISISFYFNDENIDITNINERLNVLAVNFGLLQQDWKLPFIAQKSNSTTWNRAFFKRIELVLKK